MRISHGTRIKSINPACGYGYATHRIRESLEALGHEFVQNDPDAPVQMWFDQPGFWKWNDNDQYRIGYHPWESTKLKPGWVKKMNETDEIWTPSPLIAQWYVEDGVKVPVYVYEHGVGKEFFPAPRKVEGKLKILHIGTEAARKGGMEVLRAFRAAFRGRDDVELTLKMINPGFNLPTYGPINIINRTLGEEELADLFREHHIYAYPSWGEGFGLTPLQALATGMPTITLPDWAPYAKYLDPRLNVPSQMMTSPWPKIHPGHMFAPSLETLVDRLRFASENYENLHDFAQQMAPKVRKEYDWLSKTAESFDALENRLKNSSKSLALGSSA